MFIIALVLAVVAAAALLVAGHLGRQAHIRNSIAQLGTRIAALELAMFDPAKPAEFVSLFGYTGPWPPGAGTIMPAGFPVSLLSAARTLLQDRTQQGAAAVGADSTSGGGVNT